MYSTVVNDTFELISRKSYGSEIYAENIKSANPGIIEPLTAGINLIIPTLPDAQINLPQNTDSNSDTEIALLIEGERFRFWTNLRLTTAMDNIDIVEFNAPFNFENVEFRNIFKPFTYKKVVVTVGGIPVFTGVMVSVVPMVSRADTVISVGCYSLPGILNDSVMPASSYPISYDELTIKEWAILLCKPFGISVEFTGPIGDPFERLSIENDETILSFLIKLSKQRNLVISSTSTGKLLFQQSIKNGSPVQIFYSGLPPVESVVPFFNSQDYYSHITGIKPTVTGQEGSQYTVKNSRLNGVLRQSVFTADDSNDGDIKFSVEARIGRMFANSVSYELKVSTWFDHLNNLWKPNTTVILNYPRAMIYNDYEFIVRNIDFKNEPKSINATLNLVLPGSFSGEIPEVLPWE